MEQPTRAGPDDTVDPRDRRARRVATTSVVLLAVAVVGLYAWIQSRDPAGSTSTTSTGFGGPVAGQRAPSFTVETLDGATFSLQDHLDVDGRPVFLNLWATWCEPCRAEMPAIEAASRRYPNVAFVGVAILDRNYDGVVAFVEEISVTYTIGYDRSEEVSDSYPVLGMPATFLISEEGLILHRRFGQLTEGEIDGFIATYFGG